MDYRKIDLSGLVLAKQPGGGPKKCFWNVRYDAAKLAVQTPPCRFPFEVHPQYNSLTLDTEDEAFLEFIRAMERKLYDLADSKDAVLRSVVQQNNPSYPPNVRVKVPDTCRIFGGNNELTGRVEPKSFGSCILEPSAYMVDGTFGVSFKATQIKAVPQSPGDVREPANLETSEYMFAD